MLFSLPSIRAANNFPPLRCAVCQGTEIGFHLHLQVCATCGHYFRPLATPSSNIGESFGHDYFVCGEYVNYPQEKEIIQENFRLRMAVLQKFLHPEKHRKLLEIGAAYGFFLQLAQDHFQEVRGIDVSKEATKYARDSLGMNVTCGDFLQENFSTSFDVVCLWDTIEHLVDPTAYVEKISRHLPSGGLLAITTGDIGSLNARFRGKNWRLLHAPTHYHFFSKKSLLRLLERFGFEPRYVRYCGFVRSLDFAMHRIISQRFNSPRLYEQLRKLGISNWKIYLNLYDILYIVAEKK